MRKNFLSLNIPKLPVCTTELGIDIIKKNLNKLTDWKNLTELVTSKFLKSFTLKKSGLAGVFSASLELTKEGLVKITQKKSFDEILIKEKK